MAISRIPDDLDVVRGILYATALSLTLWALVWVLVSLLASQTGSP